MILLSRISALSQKSSTTLTVRLIVHSLEDGTNPAKVTTEQADEVLSIVSAWRSQQKPGHLTAHRNASLMTPFRDDHLAQLHCCRSLPHEEMHMIAPRAYFEGHMRALHIHVIGKSGAFLFTLNQLGFATEKTAASEKLPHPPQSA
jgi:hypothetical protein